jgi:transcriptional regulator with XRE-family HTH domain
MFGIKIKRARQEQALSCSELARRSGHSISSIHGIETGANKNPRFQIICDISDVLGISANELKTWYQGKEEKNA